MQIYSWILQYGLHQIQTWNSMTRRKLKNNRLEGGLEKKKEAYLQKIYISKNNKKQQK